MNLLPLPVLAFEVGEIIGIILLVLSVLGWFVKAVKGQGEHVPPAARRPAPNPRRTEIETFLEEIGGSAVRKPPMRAAPPNRPVNQPRPANVAAAKKPNKPQKPPTAAKPAAPLSEQHLAKSQVGEGLRSHVSSFIKAERIPADTQQYMANRIVAEVRADLGPSRSTSTTAPTIDRTPAHPLVTLLRNPEGVRQAIALQEILQRPKRSAATDLPPFSAKVVLPTHG